MDNVRGAYNRGLMYSIRSVCRSFDFFLVPENPNNLFGHSKRRYSNIQLMLREGPPPPPPEKEFDGHDREKYFLDKLRKRQILNSW